MPSSTKIYGNISNISSSNSSSDVVLESGNVLESDSSPYFEDSDLDLYPEDSDSAPEDLDSDSNIHKL